MAIVVDLQLGWSLGAVCPHTFPERKLLTPPLRLVATDLPLDPLPSSSSGAVAEPVGDERGAQL